MPRNSSGNYQAPASSWSPAINGALAAAGDWNALLADISAALTDSVSRGGNGSLTANLNMGNNKIVSLSPGVGAGQAVEWTQLFGAGTMADIASAATVDIGVQNTSFLRVTGTTTITSFGSNFRGPRFITFEGAVTLTNSSTLVLPGGANITTAAGDTLIVIPGATAGTADKWIVVAYQKAQVPAAIASTAEAQAGTNNTNFITPLRMREGFNASGTAPVYACRAWVNFNGTGTVAIRASGNVSSITDNGTGDYTVNFTTAMPDANYAPVALCRSSGGADIVSPGLQKNVMPTASSFRLQTSENTAGGLEDPTIVAVSVFR